MIHYHSSGWRDYQKQRVAVSPRRCWEYQCILSGDIQPTFAEIAAEAPAMPTPVLWVFAPGQLHGWRSRKGGEISVFHSHYAPRLLEQSVGEWLVQPLSKREGGLIRDLSEQVGQSTLHQSPLTPLQHQTIINQLALLVLRQRPELQLPVAMDSEKILLRSQAWFDVHMESGVGVREMARAMGYSVSHFRRLFHHHAGMSPARMLQQERLQRAFTLLKSRQLLQAGIADACGFGSVQAFSRFFHTQTGMTAAQWQSRQP